MTRKSRILNVSRAHQRWYAESRTHSFMDLSSEVWCHVGFPILALLCWLAAGPFSLVYGTVTD